MTNDERELVKEMAFKNWQRLVTHMPLIEDFNRPINSLLRGYFIRDAECMLSTIKQKYDLVPKEE